MRQWPRVRGIITWHPYLFTRPAYRPRRRHPAGHGTIAQMPGDLEQLRSLGAGTVVLDPFNGDPEETSHPEATWRALATVVERCTE
jgi:hypothetical protein